MLPDELDFTSSLILQYCKDLLLKFRALDFYQSQGGKGASFPRLMSRVRNNLLDKNGKSHTPPFVR